MQGHCQGEGIGVNLSVYDLSLSPPVSQSHSCSSAEFFRYNGATRAIGQSNKNINTRACLVQDAGFQHGWNIELLASMQQTLSCSGS